MHFNGLKAATLDYVRRLNFTVSDFFIVDHALFQDWLKSGEEPTRSKLRKQIETEINNRDSLKRVKTTSWMVRPSISIDEKESSLFDGQFESFYPLHSIDEITLAIEATWSKATSDKINDLLNINNIRPYRLNVTLVVQEYIEANQIGWISTRNPKTDKDHELYVQTQKSPLQSLELSPALSTSYRLSWNSSELILSGENVEHAPLGPHQLAILREMAQRLHVHFQHPQKIKFALRNERIYFIDTENLPLTSHSANGNGWAPSVFRGHESQLEVALPLMSDLYSSVFSESIVLFLKRIGLWKSNRFSNVQWHQSQSGRDFWNHRAFLEAWKEVPMYSSQDFQDLLGGFDSSMAAGTQNTFSLNGAWQFIKVEFYLTFGLRRHLRTSGKFLNEIKGKLSSLPFGFLNQSNTHLCSEWDSLITSYRLAESQYVFTRIMALAAHVRFRRILKPYRRANPSIDEWALISKIGSLKSTELVHTLEVLGRAIRRTGCLTLVAQLLEKKGPLNYTDLECLPPDVLEPLKTLIQNFGYLSDNDLDLRAPRWSYDLRAPLRAVYPYSVSTTVEPSTTDRKDHQGATDATPTFEDMYEKLVNTHLLTLMAFVPFTRHRTLKALGDLRQLLALQNEWREITSRYYDKIQSFVFELSQYVEKETGTSVDPCLFFFATEKDITAFLHKNLTAEGLLARAQQEKNLLAGYVNHHDPLNSNPPTNSTLSPLSPPTLMGSPASSGRSKGRAKVLRTPADFYDLRKGDIFILGDSSMDLTPFYGLAGGIIRESGSPIDDHAQFAREFGIPTVCGVQSATSFISNAQEIEIDGACGEVYLF